MDIPMSTKILWQKHYEFKVQNKLDILRKISGNECIRLLCSVLNCIKIILTFKLNIGTARFSQFMKILLKHSDNIKSDYEYYLEEKRFYIK